MKGVTKVSCSGGTAVPTDPVTDPAVVRVVCTLKVLGIALV